MAVDKVTTKIVKIYIVVYIYDDGDSFEHDNKVAFFDKALAEAEVAKLDNGNSSAEGKYVVQELNLHERIDQTNGGFYDDFN